MLTATSQMSELLSLNQANIPTYQASHIAVQDFWQLVRVSILNFAVLVGLYIFSKEDLFTHKGLRLISMLLFTLLASLPSSLIGNSLVSISHFMVLHHDAYCQDGL